MRFFVRDGNKNSKTAGGRDARSPLLLTLLVGAGGNYAEEKTTHRDRKTVGSGPADSPTKLKQGARKAGGEGEILRRKRVYSHDRRDVLEGEQLSEDDGLLR